MRWWHWLECNQSKAANEKQVDDESRCNRDVESKVATSSKMINGESDVRDERRVPSKAGMPKIKNDKHAVGDDDDDCKPM